MSDLLVPLPGNTNLAALTYQFEVQVARTLHPTWAEHLLPLDTTRWRSKLAEPWISAYLLKRARLDRPFSKDRRSPAQNLMLLPPDVLMKLVRLTGAVLMAPSLRRVVDGQTMRELGQSTGANITVVVRKLAPFLYREGSLGSFSKDDNESWPDAVARVGITALVAGTSQEHMGAIGRLKLKLDHRWADHFETGSGIPARDAFVLLKKILIREVDPQWTPLF